MTIAKEAAGRRAADYVSSGMVVGLGTGSTAFYFIDEIGRRIQNGTLTDIRAVSTSSQSEAQAKSLGIPTVNMDDVQYIDVLVDGADETLKTFSGIKGGGGALLLEKIVAQSSRRIIWIVDEGKVVEQLGAFPLPVEVVRFGSWNLFYKFDEAGMNPRFRKSGRDSLFLTDSDNYIIDLQLNEIPNPAQLNFELNNVVGVVEHGLFLNYPETIIIGKEDGTIEEIHREQAQA